MHADKWVLSSAVQKLIRPGNSDRAIHCALRLLQFDPSYLRRRLPVIAYEDIGLGNA